MKWSSRAVASAEVCGWAGTSAMQKHVHTDSGMHCEMVVVGVLCMVGGSCAGHAGGGRAWQGLVVVDVVLWWHLESILAAGCGVGAVGVGGVTFRYSGVPLCADAQEHPQWLNSDLRTLIVEGVGVATIKAFRRSLVKAPLSSLLLWWWWC